MVSDWSKEKLGLDKTGISRGGGGTGMELSLPHFVHHHHGVSSFIFGFFLGVFGFLVCVCECALVESGVVRRGGQKLSSFSCIRVKLAALP